MGRPKPDYIVFVHRLYSGSKFKKGGLDIILEYLAAIGKKILLVEYPLNYRKYRSINVRLIDGKNERTLHTISSVSKINVVCWPFEFLISVFYAVKYRRKGQVVISADPLTTFPAVILRKLGLFKFHYYHSVDYSTDRFVNRMINTIYFRLLVFGMKHADLIGVITPKMMDKLESISVKKLFYIPNSPDFKALEKYRTPINKREAYSLVVTCAEVSNKFKVFDIIELVNRLKKDFPKIILHVNGPYDVDKNYYDRILDFIKTNKLGKNVVFHGMIPKPKNLEIIGKCKIGLAFYNKEISHIEFGDSLKIREYAALGLPMVADNATCTAKEMETEKAGIMVTEAREAYQSLKKLLGNKAEYVKYQKKAQSWAKKLDKRLIMNKLYDDYFA
jgi:glycosyltransferase involved in cell wall biosynthesis